MKATGFITIAFFGLGLVLLGETPAPTRTPFAVDQVDVSQISEEEIAKTIAHRNALFNQEQQANDGTQTAAKTQAQSLVNAANASKDSADALLAYQKGVAAKLTEANNFLAERPHLLAQLHRAKFLASALIAAIAVFVIFKVGGKIGLIAGGILGAGGIAAIWAWL